ncbi:efflux RND transporter periplasmic adaptor subunit [Pseudobacter ginsenosidimutans]|uniref:Multidrug efflux pump subunit AcrA (Membrane-fusion protein) n=1 Tax=Pseudobacter ginsenosidimutans TaxID=661488 RepID=A0A4Q7N4A3_9BACT|nr:efflux RND transporter periplasmic adaptor subunit [Pseudobacter ginsenosidimutans]QEC44352.1 efflux RND transporter periplasmic adaptor subunit [Pseudobacter ginsenosidimutans]RZS75818.1 multidrug efflux pump subunit AcrA (membrane-fusion protein) [Pseudobacter ginsenosidimutans]
MRNSYIVSVIAVVLFFISCKEKTAPAHSGGHKETVIGNDVKQLTQPANQRVIASIPVVKGISGSRIIASEVNGIVNYDTRHQTSISSRVSGRIERLLIKYNYQPVKKGELIMELYSPDLAAAQQELLYLAGTNDDAMLQRAKEKLQLAGMQPAQITAVLRSGKILYRVPVYSPATGYILEKTAAAPVVTVPQTAAPAGDGMSGMGGTGVPVNSSVSAPSATPVLLREGQYVNAGQSIFTIYQSEQLLAGFAFPPAMAAKIRNGQSILFWSDANKTDMFSGKIGLIEPVFRNGENFTLARVYLNQQGFQAGQLLTASVPVVYRNSWWLPKEAVWMQGQQAVVFIRENNVFNPVQIKTGVIDKEWIQVLSDLNGLEIAANAYYLVDSESFIKVHQSLQ